jgi:pimeloyl-ACP methyl ester carboxylesterase
MLTLNLDRTSARAMQAAVQCNEEIPFSTYDDLLAIASPVQRQIRDNFALELESIYTICDRWGLPTPDPLENQAVVSAIPVLLLAGEYDPITPPEWAALTAETLTAATVFYFPAVGHWVMRSGPAGVCAIEVSLGFLTNPALAPDSACISGLGPPAFALP